MRSETLIESVEYKGYTIEVHQDFDPTSPRDWDNLGRLVLNHRRYDLPKDIDIDLDDFGSWAEVEAELRKHHDAKVVLPVWGYDHSGLSLKAGDRTYPFSDRWDSGQAGLVVATGADIREAYEVSRVTPQVRAKVEDALKSEVATFNDYLTGQVYGYVVKDPAGENVDSCWGIYLDESGFDYPLSEGRAFVDAEIEAPSEDFWTVVDTEAVDENQHCLVLGRFATEAAGSEFITTLPDYETGRYGLDAPTLIRIAEEVTRCD